MPYFNQDFIDFFIQLAPNNNKEWFDENRNRYHQNIKTPFENFIRALINEMQKIDRSINIEPKDAIFRINRDIRFSKDKSPYKLSRSAVISPGGKKDKNNPGMYIQLTPEHVRVYAGAYEPNKEQLLAIREEIAHNLSKFNTLITDQQFKKTFGEIKGEKNKVIPKELKEAGKKQPLIYNKNFYIFTSLPPEIILQENLPQLLVEKYKIALPFVNFLKKPLNI